MMCLVKVNDCEIAEPYLHNNYINLYLQITHIRKDSNVKQSVGLSPKRPACFANTNFTPISMS